MIHGEFHQTILLLANVLVATATSVKAKRQLRKLPTSIGSEMYANLITFQWVSKYSLKKRNSVVAEGWNYAEVKLIFF